MTRVFHGVLLAVGSFGAQARLYYASGESLGPVRDSLQPELEKMQKEHPHHTVDLMIEELPEKYARFAAEPFIEERDQLLADIVDDALTYMPRKLRDRAERILGRKKES